ncbi:uncharacterized protein LOC110767200 isoform X2 [Prunus avium]|uniref:Uncharacterized protein LOC110767200 isoform X2 n=1 Tax=Prunus avium TaxID=42229 RepID=A0A6P5TGZ6_PRUAV|nr:uncharacterized protein LOC110767200 isoform X2 [Prunus avium]
MIFLQTCYCECSYYFAEKKIPSIHGNTMGVKLQQFIFDAFPYTPSTALFEVAGETINFIMEAEVFGSPHSTHILHEDILQFGEMSEISGTCIVIYMRYLHEVLKMSNMLSMIGFVDPAVIGALGCGDVSQRSRVLATRFSSAHPDQIFLLPYKFGDHLFHGSPK